MNMTHPDILAAERTGYPYRVRIEPERYQCECGEWTSNPIDCEYCSHMGCRKCMTYDEEIAEWFCYEDCRDNYLNERKNDDKRRT